MFHGSFKSVSRVLQRSFKEVLCKFQRYFNKILGCFKKVSWVKTKSNRSIGSLCSIHCCNLQSNNSNGSVPMKYQECFIQVSFIGSFKGVSLKFQESFKGVMREFLGSFEGVSRVFQRSF